MRAIDSNLLVYASLAGHPAMVACELAVASHAEWVTSVANLVELHRVLVGVYGVAELDADAKFRDWHRAIHVDAVDGSAAQAALALGAAHRIDFNDALLLRLCITRGIGVLATDDGALATACSAHGIAVENPISPALRAAMAAWEDQNLPAKGLPRILARIHRWLGDRDAALAEAFHSASQALSRLP